MKAAFRNLFHRVRVLWVIYTWTRKRYHAGRLTLKARRHIVNWYEYSSGLLKHDNARMTIRFRDGVNLTIRRNLMDAFILAEIFIDECYTKALKLPTNPVVVDIGGYNGDFAVFAATRLKARKVVAFEPSPQNLELAAVNAYPYASNQIALVPLAVTGDGKDVLMDVGAENQARVTAHGRTNGNATLIPGISLEEALHCYAIEGVDLLKVDCEGGEYEILLQTPEPVLANIRNIVFEYHEIDGWKEKLAAVIARLKGMGFRIWQHNGDLCTAVQTER